jgi:hypothetical protein
MTQLNICAVIAQGFTNLKSTKNDVDAIHQIQQLQCFLGQIRDDILKGLYGCYDNTFFDTSKIYHVYEDRNKIEINRITNTVNINLDFAYEGVGRINVTISALGNNITNLPGNIDIRQIDGLPYITSRQYSSKSLNGAEIGLLIQNFATTHEMNEQLQLN